MMRRALSILGVAALVTLAACSSSDKKETSTATTVATSGTGLTTPTYTGSSESEFCKLGRENNRRLQEITGAAGDPAALNKVLEEAAPAVRQAANVAPDSIKTDVTILADGFEKLLKSLQDGQADTSVILDPQFSVAAQHLSAYAQQVCGITTG